MQRLPGTRRGHAVSLPGLWPLPPYAAHCGIRHSCRHVDALPAKLARDGHRRRGGRGRVERLRGHAPVSRVVGRGRDKQAAPRVAWVAAICVADGAGPGVRAGVAAGIPRPPHPRVIPPAVSCGWPARFRQRVSVSARGSSPAACDGNKPITYTFSQAMRNAISTSLLLCM